MNYPHYYLQKIILTLLDNLFFTPYLRNKWGHTILYVLFVLFLSLIPQEKLPKPLFSSIDLGVHFIMYGGLAYALSLSLFSKIKDGSISKLEKWLPLLLGSLGLFIEFLQKTLPINRFFSWEDALCNFLGACSFYFIALRIKAM